MGFVTGLTGGVTLTLSLAYLSVLAHQRSREQQGRSLRSQALAIQSLIDPIPQPLPPTRSEVAAAKRAEAVEVAKDRWNEEVENAVKWVQHTDWNEVREGLEDRIGALWDRAFGESIQDSASKAKSEVQSVSKKAKGEVENAAGKVASKAKGAFEKTKEEGEDFEAKVKDNALRARLVAWREAQKAENEARQKASEAQGAVASALDKGKEKANEVVGKVKSAVGLSGAGAAPETVALPPSNPVAKALDQRFEKVGSDKRTVAEVLAERYTPMDKRDNTVLRGL
ncbi:hypothetical protein J3458_005582 [Metarhizium acridum]|uniref:MICOS complex subunit MIC12 n=1 Tax=Metarhizium acridum (strain CQMa 102) TaxID=655827 RepID=E9E1R5_METAQ|nr:uncharacterized protein MAC_03883 [Metarhizium acridum CQMa 102]EFY90125.1 hypothetical protein MAC_03883 [Metarhizium acridum CQMa 102]KAG8418146.1 hypothetical protein J3458_005582 [Metarhizium acridum]